jgi:hypothetical protein
VSIERRQGQILKVRQSVSADHPTLGPSVSAIESGPYPRHLVLAALDGRAGIDVDPMWSIGMVDDPTAFDNRAINRIDCCTRVESGATRAALCRRVRTIPGRRARPHDGRPQLAEALSHDQADSVVPYQAHAQHQGTIDIVRAGRQGGLTRAAGPQLETVRTVSVYAGTLRGVL